METRVFLESVPLIVSLAFSVRISRTTDTDSSTQFIAKLLNPPPHLEHMEGIGNSPSSAQDRLKRELMSSIKEDYYLI